MIIVGTDVETTGLGDDDEIVEFGAAVYDTSVGTFLACHSDLIKTSKWSAAAEAVHGIRQAAADLGRGGDLNPWTYVAPYKPKLALAHNAAFDRPRIIKRWPEFGTINWLCTYRDLPHEQVVGKAPCKKLQHLAVDYGIQIQYQHRALFDAMLCCLVAARHDLVKASKLIGEPQFVVSAWHPGRPNFNDQSFITQKDYLKKAGFRWEGGRWVKEAVRESQLSKYLALASNKPGWETEHRRTDD